MTIIKYEHKEPFKENQRTSQTNQILPNPPVLLERLDVACCNWNETRSHFDTGPRLPMSFHHGLLERFDRG